MALTYTKSYQINCQKNHINTFCLFLIKYFLINMLVKYLKILLNANITLSKLQMF